MSAGISVNGSDTLQKHSYSQFKNVIHNPWKLLKLIKGLSYDMSSGKMEGAIRMASLTGKNTSITIRLP